MSTSFYIQHQVPSVYLKWWIDFKKNKLALSALVIFIFILLVAIFANLIAPFDPTTQFENATHIPPTWYNNGDVRFLLGTDDLGRDLFSRLVYGARLSLSLASLVVIISSIIGITLGSLLAFSPSWIDIPTMRIMSFILSLPSLLLAIVIVAIIGPGLPNAIYAVMLVLIPHFLITTRSAIKIELKNEYVTAMYLDGANKFQLLKYSILPNIFPSIILQLVVAFSSAILEIAALGFLGLGAQAPYPEWGTILSESHDYLVFAPWSVAVPGLAIFFTILSINLVAEGLRDVMNVEKNS
ncbi:MAG: dipeptide ABC transporter permease DppC [Kangiella sp.]|nr:MAG: dipeptide ABC transporter permease DppC [Kangiella sp.]